MMVKGCWSGSDEEMLEYGWVLYGDVWVLCHEVIVLVCFFYAVGRIAS